MIELAPWQVDVLFWLVVAFLLVALLVLIVLVVFVIRGGLKDGG
jgi:hypothetical protein